MPESAEACRKRVLFRSHHTGMKENNLLIGVFADRHLASMSDDDVAWFEQLLMRNDDIDLYNWILGKKPFPPELDHPVMRRLISFKDTLSPVDFIR